MTENDAVLYEIGGRTHLGYIVGDASPSLQALAQEKLIKVRTVWVAGSNRHVDISRSIKISLVRFPEKFELRVFKRQIIEFILTTLSYNTNMILLKLMKQSKIVLGTRSWKQLH